PADRGVPNGTSRPPSKVETGAEVLAADSGQDVSRGAWMHRDATDARADRQSHAEGRYNVKLIVATTMATTLALTPLLAADNEPAKRLDDAAAVFSEITATPDKGIPQELLENAHCIVIVPDLKTAAFVVGGKY